MQHVQSLRNHYLYLAKEVAAILREILTHPKKLYDDNTAHLLCSNYWLQPIYQELLHSSLLQRRMVKRIGPAMVWPESQNTLGRHQIHRLDWRCVLCDADTLQIWFPAHSALLYCASCSERRTSTELPTSLRWTRMMFLMIFESSSRRHGPIGLQFKVGDFKFKSSNIRILTGTLKADWIQLPVKRYLAALPTLKQGVIAGVFKIKGASSWAITRTQKLQVSACLPNELSMDDWYAGVYARPQWPDVSIMGSTICAGWSAMIFTTYGRSMMCHVGQCSPTLAIIAAAA